MGFFSHYYNALRPVQLAVALGLLLVAAAGHAIDLDEAKRTGLVGETAEGYVGLVNPSAPAEVRALVDDVNARRRAEYQRIARDNGIALEQVEALAARKAIEKTPSGGWVRIDGTWRPK
jgi:uncharacterized protein YdbL (DUF1318 family)